MNEQTVTVISGLIALISAIVTGFLAYRKTKSEQDITLALSDRNQNVELVKNLQVNNGELEKSFKDLIFKFQELQASNAEMRVKVVFLENYKEQWQKERDIWQKERENWQGERSSFEKERRDWIKERDSWEDERIDLMNRIKELELSLARIEKRNA